jgi:hypothetical protein
LIKDGDTQMSDHHVPLSLDGEKVTGIGTAAADPIRQCREALEEWRSARQDIFDNITKISEENVARWKRLANAEQALMNVARAALSAAQSPKPVAWEIIDREEMARLVEQAIRQFCQNLGTGTVRVSADGVERIYYAGLSLNAISVAAVRALRREASTRMADSPC